MIRSTPPTPRTTRHCEAGGLDDGPGEDATVAALRSRVAELEACVRRETPRSIAALGERLTLVLEEAEAGAECAMSTATAEAETLVSAARHAAASLEAGARQRAGDLLRDAEQRADDRRREIEAWVDRVRAHVDAEHARAAEEFAVRAAQRAEELSDLEHRRDVMVAHLADIGDALRATVDAARSAPSAGGAAGQPERILASAQPGATAP